MTNLQSIEDKLKDIMAQAGTIGEQVVSKAEEQGKSEIAESARATTKSIVAPITPITEIDTTPSPSIGDKGGDTIANGNGTTKQFDSDLEAANKRIAELETQQQTSQTAKSSILDLIKKKDELPEYDAEATTKKVLAEYGLTQASVSKVQGFIAQLATYNQQIVDLQAKKQEALDRTVERTGISLEHMGLEQNRITRLYDREISTKSAQASVVSQQIQMERGLWDDARATASMIVDAATYDQQQDLADIEWGIEAYQDLYNIMADEEKTAWNRQYAQAQQDLDDAKETATQVNNLMLNYPNAGIKIGDSVDEATQKVNEYQIANPEGQGLYTETKGGFEILRDSAGNMVSSRVAGTTGAEADTASMFTDESTGKEYNFNTTAGLKNFKEDYPEYTYEDMDAFLYDDAGIKNGTIRKGLLEGAGFSPIAAKERSYDNSFMVNAAREALKRDYKKSSSDFMQAMKSNFKDLTEADEIAMEEAYKSEQAIVSGLNWLERRQYFKL